jgi:Core-2/I-Branching enzyme
MKICYIILVHHKFEQAIRLIKRLSAPGVSFVIHVDKKIDNESFHKFKGELASCDCVFYAKRERCKWGSYELALAVINCIETAIQAGIEFDRCVSISGQDYPIVSNSKIKEFFLANPEAEFIEAIPKDVVNDRLPPKAWTPYYRFRRYHFWIGARRCSIPFPIKSPPDLQIFHGSAWWALSRACVEQLLIDIKKNNQIRRFFKTSFMVDEVYIQTILMASQFSGRVVGKSLTYAAWTVSSGPHPKVLTSEDFCELTESNKLFARKFDADLHPEILTRLDASLTT